MQHKLWLPFAPAVVNVYQQIEKCINVINRLVSLSECVQNAPNAPKDTDLTFSTATHTPPTISTATNVNDI